MKIAIVYDAVFPYVKGGGERRYHELARRLAGRGHDVHVVSWRYWPGPASHAIDGVTYRGVGRPPALYGPGGRRRMAEAASFAARALPALLRERYDVIDCGSVPFLVLFAARLATRVHRGRLVATWFEYWDDYWQAYRPGVAGRAARVVERAAARLGDARIAISARTAERLPPGPRTYVIEPAADAAAIDAAPAAGAVVDVVSAGRLNAQKNLPLLLRALAHARDGGRPLTCAVLSDGPERAALERETQRLGLGGSVRFEGAIADDRAFYGRMKAAKVLAWPSLAEGFGITPLEAMACGLPVVAAASPYSATEALVRDAGAGIVTVAEPAPFAAALRALVDDAPGRERMSAAARAWGRRSTWDTVAGAVERVYADAIAPAPSRAQGDADVTR
jgi:glycosyltransferase involved in cell wall biosynthesis